MLPYSATDILRVMQYELIPESAREYGSRLASDVTSDDNGDDDRQSDGGGRGQLIRLLVHRSPSPSAA